MRDSVYFNFINVGKKETTILQTNTREQHAKFLNKFKLMYKCFFKDRFITTHPSSHELLQFSGSLTAKWLLILFKYWRPSENDTDRYYNSFF